LIDAESTRQVLVNEQLIGASGIGTGCLWREWRLAGGDCRARPVVPEALSARQEHRPVLM